MSLQRYLTLFTALAPADVERFAEYFAPDARFRDPFNDVRGVPAIQAVFRHMFRTCDQPRFEVLRHLSQGDLAFVEWVFTARVHGRSLRIEGVSRIYFDATGRVREHIDFWDAADQVYERLPLIGELLRGLKRRFRAEPTSPHS